MAIENGFMFLAFANTTFVCVLLLLGIHQFSATLELKMERLTIYLAWVLVLLATSTIEISVYLAIINGSELANGIFILTGLLTLVSFTGYYFRHIAKR